MLMTSFAHHMKSWIVMRFWDDTEKWNCKHYLEQNNRWCLQNYKRSDRNHQWHSQRQKKPFLFFCLAPYALVVTYLFTKEINENDFKTVKNKLLNFRDNSISYFVLFVCGCFTIMHFRSFDKSRSPFCVE